MLQRAASNAYSWWWASHIRTKQSKWLEENLHGMEERVTSMLKIIENDEDSFVQRVEMYFRKRPELINHVEECYRVYRALAERYDHLSKDLQSANRTIATVFPEQVQLSMDDDDDDDEEQEEANIPSTFTSPDDVKGEFKLKNIPKAPSFPKKELRSLSGMSLRNGKLSRTASSAKVVMPPSSGLSKEEAQEEIDKIQKEILALQTEKEFLQSVFERCYAKCWGIENQITDMQAKVSSLQDEFGIGNVIDDDEAQTLMASTALKSCREMLVKLQQKQEKSAEEAEVENQRIKEVHQKFTTLKGEIFSGQSGISEPTDDIETGWEDEDQRDMQSACEKIENEIDADSKSSLTIMQLADRIDELVEKVASLETEVSSQGALVNRLRSETDGLQEKIKTLEGDKETLMQSSEIMNKKLNELEEELYRLKNLNECIKCQNHNLQTHFTEASCKIKHLSEKLQTVMPDEGIENPLEIQDASVDSQAKGDNAVESHIETQAPSTGATETEKEEKNDGVEVPEKHMSPRHIKEDERKYLSETEEEVGMDEEKDQPNWRLHFTNSLEEREKLLLEEYSLVLQNYKEVRKKLGDVEKKNRDGFFELALQIRELKNTLAMRDEEINSLRKMGFPWKNQDELVSISTKDKYAHREGSLESMTQAASIVDNLSSVSSPQQPVFEAAKMECLEKYPTEEVENAIKPKSVDFPRCFPAIEEKVRSDIDELLEENLELWLRFSTSFHQIQKFQTSIQDLKAELSKLKDNRKKQEGSGKMQSLISEARPIFKHLREIQTDLTLWLENNLVLKDELQTRCASLCNIQEEISRISTANSEAEEPEISKYQAAKFQGEITNMKQEGNKVAEELETGLERVKGLKDDVEKVLTNLDEELGISASHQRSSSMHRARIPLRSFLFGVKLKRHKQQPQKPSMFSCTGPGLQKQYSDNMAEAGKSSR